MNIKTATYTGTDGKKFQVKYDADTPCWFCGEPVGEASVGGTVVCPACDCGKNRDGTKWSWKQCDQRMKHFRSMQENTEKEVKKEK